MHVNATAQISVIAECPGTQEKGADCVGKVGGIRADS